MKHILRRLGIIFTATLITGAAHATPLTTVWDGWNLFADGEETSSTNTNTQVGPGYGGQLFDAEYLFYKLDTVNNTLSIGLQTGFNVDSGLVTHSGKNYYAGDLALSFDGDASTYEYAVDFGRYTEDYYGNVVGAGTDPEGLYSVTSWNTGVYTGFTVSNPFAMNGGSIVANALSNNGTGSGTADGVTSYYRQVTFDLSGLGLGDTFQVDAHWTMSCGNDNINGSFNVQEPSTLFLLGLGLLGLGLIRLRKVKA